MVLEWYDIVQFMYKPYGFTFGFTLKNFILMEIFALTYIIMSIPSFNQLEILVAFLTYSMSFSN